MMKLDVFDEIWSFFVFYLFLIFVTILSLLKTKSLFSWNVSAGILIQIKK